MCSVLLLRVFEYDFLGHQVLINQEEYYKNVRMINKNEKVFPKRIMAQDDKP